MNKTIHMILWIFYIFFLFLAGCQTNKNLFKNEHFSFEISTPISLDINQSSNYSGTIWYDEEEKLHSGEFGLFWVSSKSAGRLPINAISMIISPDGKNALVDAGEFGISVRDYKKYLIFNHQYLQTNVGEYSYAPIFCDEKTICSTSWDEQANTVTITQTNIETGEQQETSLMDPALSADPSPKIGRNGILTYNWYQNYSKPRLVVYDTNKQEEVTYYEEINDQIRPSHYGYLLNPEGTRILSISSHLEESIDGFQQELFGVEIGSEPVQITNFHATYPDFLIYNLNFGGNIWSPNNRWVVIQAIPAQNRDFDTSTAPTYLFLVDLKQAIAYQIDKNIQGTYGTSIAWAPDSSMFALSIGDQLWLVNPNTRETQLLVEKTDVPLCVLGWTNP